MDGYTKGQYDDYQVFVHDNQRVQILETLVDVGEDEVRNYVFNENVRRQEFDFSFQAQYIIADDFEKFVSLFKLTVL